MAVSAEFRVTSAASCSSRRCLEDTPVLFLRGTVLLKCWHFLYQNVFGLEWDEVNFCHLAQRPWHLEIQVHLAHHWNLASEVLAK